MMPPSSQNRHISTRPSGVHKKASKTKTIYSLLEIGLICFYLYPSFPTAQSCDNTHKNRKTLRNGTSLCLRFEEFDSYR